MWHASSVGSSVKVIVQYAEGNYNKISPLYSNGNAQVNDTTVYFGDFGLIIGHPIYNKGYLPGTEEIKGSMSCLFHYHMSAIK